MKKGCSVVGFIIFFIMLASVENKVSANTCVEGLGTCQQCDERCKANHGPTAKGGCDVKNQLCSCYYTCGPSPRPPQPKQCYGGTGPCTSQCGEQCCNQNCAQKYPGHTYLCKCQYPC